MESCSVLRIKEKVRLVFGHREESLTYSQAERAEWSVSRSLHFIHEKGTMGAHSI